MTQQVRNQQHLRSLAYRVHLRTKMILAASIRPLMSNAVRRPGKTVMAMVRCFTSSHAAGTKVTAAVQGSVVPRLVKSSWILQKGQTYPL